MHHGAERDLAVLRLAVGIDHHDEALALVGADRALVDGERRRGLRLAHLQARELAGDQAAVGIGEHGAHPHGAAARIDLVVDQLHAAFRVGAGHGGHAHRDAPDIGRAELGEAAQRMRHHLLVGIEARVDRIDRDQRGQHRRARAGGDEVADGHLEPADAPGHRRADLRVVEIELACLQRRARRGEVRLGLAICVEPLVEVALRDGARPGKLLAALELALGQQHARLRGRNLRLRAVDLGGVGRRVDGDQQVALLHQRAFAKVRRLHGAGDTRAHLDALDRLEPAGELVPQRDVALLDGRDRHRRCHRGGRRIVRRRAAAAENEVGCRTRADRNGDRHRGNADKDQCAPNREFFHHGLPGRCPRPQIKNIDDMDAAAASPDDVLQRNAR